MNCNKATKWYSITLNQVCPTRQSHILLLTAFLSALALLSEIEPYYFMCASVHWPQPWNASLSSILYYLLILAGSREQWKQSQPPEPVGLGFNSTIYRIAALQEHSGLPAAIPASNSKKMPASTAPKTLSISGEFIPRVQRSSNHSKHTAAEPF